MIEKIKNLLHSKSIKNSGWIIGDQVFQMGLQLIVGMITARYLGPSNYGTLSYTASFITFFVSIATLGMEGVVIKKLIEHPDEEGLYLGSSIVFRIFSSIFSILSVSLVVYVLNPEEPIKLLLVFVQSIQLIFKAGKILDSWFQRHLLSKYSSLGSMLSCVAVSAYKIYLLAAGKSIVWFAFSNSISEAVIICIMIYAYKKAGGQKLRYSFTIGKEILHESYHFIISGLMVAIYGQMDRIMLGQMLNDTAVGLYSTATTICGMWIIIPTAFINSFQPIIMEEKNNGNEKKYILRLEQLYSSIIWMCIIVALLVGLLSKPVIYILYGSAYLKAAEPLAISIWYETFAMIGSARGIWILCENKNKYVKYYLFMGTIANLILNATLIPIYGMNGAAFATLITQIITSLIAPLFFKETRIHTKLVLDAFLLKWYWGKEYK